LPALSLAHRTQRRVPGCPVPTAARHRRDRAGRHGPAGPPDRSQPGRHARALPGRASGRADRLGGHARVALPRRPLASARAARLRPRARAGAARGSTRLLHRLLPLRGGDGPRDPHPGRGAAARGVHEDRWHRGLAGLRERRPRDRRRGDGHARGPRRQSRCVPGHRASPGARTPVAFRVASASGARMPLHRRLTTIDATFLYAEKPTQPMHVGGSMVYEGHLSRDTLVRALEDRLHLLPRYRQKVVFPLFAVAHPTWEDDPAFDIRNHVVELTLPPPGNDRVLSEIGGRAFAGMLDRAHPLWRLIVVQGRADGNTAVVWKVHHAMIDGVSGVDLTMVLHDLKPDATPPEPPAAPWQPQPVPDPLTLLQDSVRDRLTEVARIATDETFRLLRPTELEARVRQLASAVTSSAPNVLRPAPRVPFNGTIGADRRFGWAEFSFGEFRHVKSVLGGTVNDVVLAVIAGGLGRYLRALGLPTDGVELRAMCPVSMRRPDQRGALGNLVSMIFAPLHVGILDPVARLTAEREAMERLKTQDQAGGLYEMTNLLEQVPPALAAVAGQLSIPNTLLNTVSTNVPGPQIPLFLSGRRLIGWYPLLPLAGDVGLCNAILTYDQRLTIGVTTDPRLVPDVWLYVECLKASFAELRDAAGRADSARRPAAPAAEPAMEGDRLVTGPLPQTG